LLNTLLGITGRGAKFAVVEFSLGARVKIAQGDLTGRRAASQAAPEEKTTAENKTQG
jgi:hypothetical protein